jgi:glycine/D-amino acid oxidase-like deaminating enzyme
MDLKSGRSVWSPAEDRLPAEYPDLTADVTCDVVVVGAGITGAQVAHALADVGLDVVLLDRRPVGHGSTSASTALIQYEIDTPLVALRKLVGRDHADRVYLECVAAVGRLSAIVAGLGPQRDAVAYRERASLYLASELRDADTLHEEWRARRALGIEVEFLDSAAIAARFPFTRPAALWSAVAAEVDPLALTRALVAAASTRARVFIGDGAMVQRIESMDGVLLRAAGGTVRARTAVLATGYESQSYLERPVATLKSTYAAATVPQQHAEIWPHDCLIWETARPYLYLRTTADHRVLVGGEDEDIVGGAARDALLTSKAETLRARAHSLIPSLDARLEFAWAGTFAESRDGLPYIDRARHMPDVWFALGYGGNGITFSVIAAEIIRDGCLGFANPAADLFRFER